MLVMMLVNLMTLFLSGYTLVPRATLKAARCWTPTNLQTQKQQGLGVQQFKSPTRPPWKNHISSRKVCRAPGLHTRILRVLLETRLFPGSPVFLVLHFDLVYQGIPSAPAPPSLLSGGRGRLATLLLHGATTSWLLDRERATPTRHV